MIIITTVLGVVKKVFVGTTLRSGHQLHREGGCVSSPECDDFSKIWLSERDMGFPMQSLVKILWAYLIFR